jgi:hypothetical protein
MFSRRSYLAVALACACLAPVTLARADVITDWNERAFATMSAEKVMFNGYLNRTMAIMHTAMFDAVNAVERRYQSYAANETAMPGTSAEAAAAGAAYTVLVKLYPNQAAVLDQAKAASLAKIADGPGKTKGFALGDSVANTLLTMRANDGVIVPNAWRPSTAPGVYVTTALPATPHLGQAKAWMLQNNDQFRPGPPPAIDSAQFARDYNETRVLGAVNSSKRTADQTEAARFWEMPGALGWNQAVSQLVVSKTMSLVDHARLRALLAMAFADSSIAVWDAKFHYNFWRPITAIRNGDLTNNPATPRDAGWTPVINTPLHPEYPAAHSINDGVGVAILEAYFGSGTLPTFTLKYDPMPGVTRQYNSIHQLAEEVSNARVWGGVHYRTSCETGEAMGKKIGEFAMANYLKPIKP